MTEPTTPRPRLQAVPAPGPRKPSLTRSASARAQRLREEALRGNPRAMRHGVFAVVSAWSDVNSEVGLIFATRPDLDGLSDRRLVEQLALAAVQHRKALIAIDKEGMSPQLTAYESRLAALVERLERAVHERDTERRKAASARETTSLDRYKPTIAGGAS